MVSSIQAPKTQLSPNGLSWLEKWQPRSLSTEAVTLPAEMYFSPDIYRLEQEKIFGKYWYYVGHISQLQGPGSYFTVDIAEQPLVILQNKEGELRAFFNICTHRAAPVATESGTCNRLTCLYHSWSFDLEGNLRGLPDMEKAENFELKDHGLKSVKVDRWGPFIFVNLDPDSDSLQVQMGELPEMFERYRFSNWHQAHSIDYWTDTNWKLYVENNAESYHEPAVHPVLAKYYQGTRAEARYHYYLQKSPLRAESDRDWSPAEPHLCAAGLNEEELAYASVMSFFPNFAWILTPGCAIIYLVDPQGPTRTRVRWDWLVPTEAAKAPDNLHGLIQFYDNIQQEDLLLLPEIQKRIQSMGYQQGRMSPTREVGTHLFQELVMTAIAPRP
jgi:phenylpropionate dioxygenase-like ring-hydroxylating dioxygenase large terminal subunit